MNTQSETIRAIIQEVHRTTLNMMGIKAPYTEERYRKEIYQAAAQFWKDGNGGGFTTRMNGTIKFGLTSAFEQGARDMGVEPDEFGEAEKRKLTEIIDGEKSHVAGLLDFMNKLANNPQAKLSDANPRLDMWGNRYQDVIGQARILFGGKKRLTWKLGPTEEHCGTCGPLSNIVAWAEEWDTAGIKPKSQDLECHGYNCLCEIVPTTKRRSPKALQRIMAIIEKSHA